MDFISKFFGFFTRGYIQTSAQGMADYVHRVFPEMETEICPSIEAVVKNADIVNVATSGADVPFIDGSWLKEGALCTLPAEIQFDKEFLLNSKKVLDNKTMHQAWEHELAGLPGGLHINIGLVSSYFIEAVNNNEMSWDDVINIGDIIAGKVQGRTDPKEKIIFGMGGMPTEDVAWAAEVYRKALEMGLGTKLNLWDEPYRQ